MITAKKPGAKRRRRSRDLFRVPQAANVLWRFVDPDGSLADYLITDAGGRPIGRVDFGEEHGGRRLARLVRDNPDHWAKSPRVLDLRGETFYHCLIQQDLVTGVPAFGWLMGRRFVRVDVAGEPLAGADFEIAYFGVFVIPNVGIQAGRVRLKVTCEEWHASRGAAQQNSGGPAKPVTPAPASKEGDKAEALTAAA